MNLDQFCTSCERAAFKLYNEHKDSGLVPEDTTKERIELLIKRMVDKEEAIEIAMEIFQTVYKYPERYSKYNSKDKEVKSSPSWEVSHA